MPYLADNPIVVGLGELLWDCFDESRRPGGAPANVAFQANQLGCRGIVCTRVGNDADGDELVRFLQQQELETRYVQRDERRPTGLVTVDTSTPGSPQFVIHENVAWDAIAFDRQTESLMQRASAVCFGTLAQRSESSRESIHRCLRSTGEGCLHVYDVNLRQNWYQREWIERSLEATDCLKLSHHEVHLLSDLLDCPDGEHRAFAHTMQQRFGVLLVCITRAENGCLLVRDDEVVDVPGSPVEVVDAVGAGDAFTAALLYALLQHWPLETAGRFANAVGGLVATRSGAMPVLTDELGDLKRQYERVES